MDKWRRHSIKGEMMLYGAPYEPVITQEDAESYLTEKMKELNDLITLETMYVGSIEEYSQLNYEVDQQIIYAENLVKKLKQFKSNNESEIEEYERYF